jgi:hypothetical protein
VSLPQYIPLDIYQGDDWSAIVNVLDGNKEPVILDGYSALAQIRDEVADYDTTVIATMNTSISAGTNVVTLSLPHSVTLGMHGEYVWDLQLTNTATGSIQTIMRGPVSVTQEVTR